MSTCRYVRNIRICNLLLTRDVGVYICGVGCNIHMLDRYMNNCMYVIHDMKYGFEIQVRWDGDSFGRKYTCIHLYLH